MLDAGVQVIQSPDDVFPRDDGKDGLRYDGTFSSMGSAPPRPIPAEIQSALIEMNLRAMKSRHTVIGL